MVVGFTYDHFWIGVPLWNNRGSFVIYEQSEEDERPLRVMGPQFCRLPDAEMSGQERRPAREE